MKWLLVAVYLIVSAPGYAQVPDTSLHLGFTRVLGSGTENDAFLSIAQDRFGFIWFTRELKGLQRFDGRDLKSYQHDPSDSNSLSDNYIECMAIDSENIFWLGTYGSGLDRFDPLKNRFVHFRHDQKRPGSLAADTISAILCDRSGNVWIGTTAGLDLLDKKSNTFRHFPHNPNDNSSLSNNDIRTIYQDRAGTIWIGCGRPFYNLNYRAEDGGLNRLDKASGTFTRYLHDPKDSNSIADSRVRAIFEDDRGRFWIGSRGDGLQTLDRRSGKFTHYPYDPAHPERLSRPVQTFEGGTPIDHIAFIDQDARGNILIGTNIQGLNYYNPVTGKMRHYGSQYLGGDLRSFADTVTGLGGSSLWRSFTTKDHQTWIISLSGNVYTTDAVIKKIPVETSVPEANTFYLEPGDSVLWIGTLTGLVRKNMQTGTINRFRHEPKNPASLCNDSVSCIRSDAVGNLWIGTGNGLSYYDRALQTFKTWQRPGKMEEGLSDTVITALLVDSEQNVFIGFAGRGVDIFNPRSGRFKHFIRGDSSSDNNYVLAMCQDKQRRLWVATAHGLIRLDSNGVKYKTYLANAQSRSVFTDKKGVVWVSTFRNLHYYDPVADVFRLFGTEHRPESIPGIIGIREDKHENLWLNANDAILRIDSQRREYRVFSAKNGILENTFFNSDDLVAVNGEIFLGSTNGYYSFFPNDVSDSVSAEIQVTDFLIDDRESIMEHAGILDAPLWAATKIQLRHDQATFSCDFLIPEFLSEGKCRYLYKLDGYDEKWRDIGSEHKAYYYNVPPGSYPLRISGVTPDGQVANRQLIIIISPPWWKTWWAYTLYVLVGTGLIWTMISVRSHTLRRTNKMLEQKVTVRTRQLQDEKEKVEKALTDLRITQDQLVQAEKMASLGELTAGIAHEIQNPLNFVNNFSEINSELLAELNAEAEKENYEDVKSIARDLEANERKILFHGRRADAIVKGMLQHSRKESGGREEVDLNALADEYLRLSYHGLRAKDKSFNAEIKTDFDPAVKKVNLVPQDISRVLLNLYNNAFYASSARAREHTDTKPVVTVETRREAGKIRISVSDNGYGVPPEVRDKIFQPFFTTKPSGEGTGLGLSLSYEIITKGHGGKLTMMPVEPHGARFVITIPEHST